VSTRPRRAVTRRKPVPGSLAYDAAEHIVTRREERAGERIGVEADDPAAVETVAARRYTGLRDELRRLLDARQHLPADVDEQLGAYRGEVTRRAEMPDDQLARELRLLLDDVDPGALPTAVWVAVKRVLDATR
jgi:hypothetical protein